MTMIEILLAIIYAGWFIALAYIMAKLAYKGGKAVCTWLGERYRTHLAKQD